MSEDHNSDNESSADFDVKDPKIFLKYQSIQNLSSKGLLDVIKSEGLDSESIEWYASEKVHGSNFSWRIHPDNNIEAAKRGGLITGSESFCGHKNVQKRIEKQLIAIKDSIYKSKPEYNNSLVTIYGEIFGGKYPHSDSSVPVIKQAKTVQHGVWYYNDVDFIAFDIRINNGEFIDFDWFESLCKENNLFYAKAVIRGTFQHCITYNVETFESTIHKHYNLPTIINNYAEGIVLKPVKTLRFSNKERVVIKLKRSTFSEVYNEPTIKAPTTVKVEKKTVEISKEGQHCIEQASRYISENRLKNVLSKMNNTDINIKLVNTNLLNDSLEDFIKENGNEYEQLKENEKKLLKIEVTKLVAKLVGQHKDKIINGEF